MSEKPFIIFGMSAFVLLIPLAVTSTDAMVKRLGGPRWRALHRLAYVAALLAALHYIYRFKVLGVEQYAYLAYLGALLGWRIWKKLVARRQGA